MWGTFGRVLHVWLQLSWASVGNGHLRPLPKKLLQVLVAGHLSRASPVMMLHFLVILKEVPPLVRTHGWWPVEASFSHLHGYLVPQMLVGFRSIEKAIHFWSKCNQGPNLFLDPCLCPLFGSLGFMVLSTALMHYELLRRKVQWWGGHAIGHNLHLQWVSLQDCWWWPVVSQYACGKRAIRAEAANMKALSLPTSVFV